MQDPVEVPAAAPPVEPDDDPAEEPEPDDAPEEPGEEPEDALPLPELVEPVAAGAAAPAPEATEAAALATDCAALATETAALAMPAPGAPAGGIATTEVVAGEAAPAGAEPVPEPEPEPELEPEAAVGVEPDAADAPELPLEDPELALSEPPDAAPHFGPLAAARLLATPAISTEAPGLGNLTSLPSGVVQSVAGMLALNMSGKDVSRLKMSSEAYASVALKESSRSRRLEPPVTVIGAQFMYISRFPIRLNHVQARA